MFETLRAGAPRSVGTVSYIGVEGYRSRAFKKSGYGVDTAYQRKAGLPRRRVSRQVVTALRKAPRGYIGPYVPDFDEGSRYTRRLAEVRKAGRGLPFVRTAYGAWQAARILRPWIFGNEAPNPSQMLDYSGSCNLDCASSGHSGPCKGFRILWKALPCRLDSVSEFATRPKFSAGTYGYTRFWTYNPANGRWGAYGRHYFAPSDPKPLANPYGHVDPFVPVPDTSIPAAHPQANPMGVPIGQAFLPTTPLSVRDTWNRPGVDPSPEGFVSGNGVPGRPNSGGTRQPPRRPAGSDDQSGLPVPRHERTPPGPGVKEKKFKGRLPVTVRTFTNITSESMEWVDCAFQALGGRKAAIRQGFGTGEYGTFVSPQNRAVFVYRNWQNLTPQKFVEFTSCVINNHIEDKLIGKGAKMQQRGLRIAWDKGNFKGLYFQTGMWMPKL